MKLIKNFFAGADKKQALAWSFYDFANSSYALLIMSFVFPIFYKERIAGATNIGDFYWGLCVSISILLGGLAAPVVGAIADYDARRKMKFIVFAGIAIVGTAGLYFTGSGALLLASVIFIITNLCFEVAQTLYDSFVGQVSTPETVGRISGLAWGLGYIGGVVSMLVLRPFYESGFDGNLESMYKLTFPLTALFFLIFSLPAFYYLKELKPPKTDKHLSWLSVKTGIKNVAATIKDLKRYKHIAWFLVGFYFLNDALVTIFSFLPIYGRTTLNLTFKEIASLLLIAQIVAFPSAAIFGWISDKKGIKKILLITIVGWAAVVLLLALANSKIMFYAVALLGALVIGASQSAARSWLSKIVPEEKRFEFFGFNGFASKISATTGPLIFGGVSVLTGNQRYAVLALLPFFIISFIIFSRIKEPSPVPA